MTDHSGCRVIETQSARIELVEPWLAGRLDPPMQDWLALPIGDSCPVDATHRQWGTANPRGYFLVRYCGTCRTKFRCAVTPHLVAEIVAALCGTPRRFILDFSPASDEVTR